MCYAFRQSNCEYLKAPVKVPIRVSWFTFLFALLACQAAAQAIPAATCNLNLPSFTAAAPNIFSDKQEQDLGDALAEYQEPDMRIAAPATDDQLARIGERLLATLPPTGLHYRFRMYDSGEINAFSFAGGRVYISRKLILAVKNEDELAGVLAHEIGHIFTHQSAIEFTRLLRIRLGVTQVTDRADIFARVHQFFTTPAKKSEEEEGEVKDELTADQVALYAMARAGYAVESFPSFLDQASLNKGKTGNWLSDAFGLTHDAARRYRSALNLIETLPPGCRKRQPGTSDSFQAWLHNTSEDRVKSAAEGIEGDKPLTLDPPLRQSLWRIRFSPDGHFILAEDESGITVMDKDAGKALFRIDAPDVESAQFTSDSKSVIFHDAKLRIEQWSVADGKRTKVKELVLFDGCNQTLLAPDSKTFACAYANSHGDKFRLGLRLIDVETGQPFFENDAFFAPDSYTMYAEQLWRALEGYDAHDLMNMLVSPDGKYLLLVAGNRLLAYNLVIRQPIELGGKLKGLLQARMSFLGPDKLYAVFNAKSTGMYVARVMTFPDGQVVKETEIANQQVESVSKGDNLIIYSLKDYPAGILDPIQGKVLTAAKLAAIDAWDLTIATEDAMGGVALTQIGTPGSKHISLPLEPLSVPSAAVFSPDGKYLAVSMKNRAGIWDLETAKQVRLVRPFTSAWMDAGDDLFGRFPKYQSFDPVELQLSMDPFSSKSLAKLDEEDVQYRDLQLSYRPIYKKGSSEQHGDLAEKKNRPNMNLRTGLNYQVDRHATLEVKQMKTQAVAWSRDFPEETPACWPAEDNRLVLAWDLNVQAAKLELAKFLPLQKQVDALKDKKKGLLLETVVLGTGVPLEQVVVPEVDVTRGSFDSRRAMVSGKFVLASSEDGVTAIYHLEDGILVGEFIGSVIATSAPAGIVAAVNREDEILLVDESTGKEIKRISFASPVRLAHIVAGKENTLLVLTADQTVHRIPLPITASALASIAPSNPN
jgi:WD40 repeat protein